MKTNAQSPGKLAESSPAQRDEPPVQTGALSGGQPGQGLNTSSSAKGQSNADAAFEQGTDYGKDSSETAAAGSTVDGDSPRSSDGHSRDDRLVREAAYRRFVARGSVHGHDEEDWLAAEREVEPPVDHRP